MSPRRWSVASSTPSLTHSAFQAATLDVGTLQTSEMWRQFFVAMNCSANAVFTRTQIDRDLFESVYTFVRDIPVGLGGEKGGCWSNKEKLFFQLSLPKLIVLSEFCFCLFLSVKRLFLEKTCFF